MWPFPRSQVMWLHNISSRLKYRSETSRNNLFYFPYFFRANCVRWLCSMSTSADNDIFTAHETLVHYRIETTKRTNDPKLELAQWKRYIRSQSCIYCWVVMIGWLGNDHGVRHDWTRDLVEVLARGRVDQLWWFSVNFCWFNINTNTVRYN